LKQHNDEETMTQKHLRGFALLDRTRRRQIASKGGKTAHARGVAHEWSSEQARAAGRKGGLAHHAKRMKHQAPAPTAV
jgi:general stress protein YciG